MPYMTNGKRDYRERVPVVPQSPGTDSQSVGTDHIATESQS